METALTTFLISISGFEIGLLLFFLNRRRVFTQFSESLAILIQIMTPAALTIPILAEHKGYIYLFIPIYVGAIHAWLFFTKHIVFGNTDWQIENAVKRGIPALRNSSRLHYCSNNSLDNHGSSFPSIVVMTLKGKQNHYYVKFLKGYGFSIKVKNS